jgi:hypothetical protein
MMSIARGLRLVSTTASRTLVRLREDQAPNLVARYLAETEDEGDDRPTN